MSTLEVGKELVELCNAGRPSEAMDRLYHTDIVSIEAGGPQPVTNGIAGVRAKGQWWEENHTIHSHQVNGPFVNGDQFAAEFKYDVTEKSSGKRFLLHEIGVYTVSDGKVIAERFFYNM